MVYGCFMDWEAKTEKVCFLGDSADSGCSMGNNNTIRKLTGEYKKIEPDCREGVWAQLGRMKQLCKERNNLYEKQNDLKGQKWKIEKSLER